MKTVPSRRALAGVIALGLAAVLPASAADRVAPGPASPSAVRAAASDPGVLILESGIFDPTRVDLDFGVTGTEGIDKRYAIVQFKAHRLGARKAMLARGVEIVAYVPNNAYTVRLNGVPLDALQGNPNVRWAGYVRSGMKLDPSLWSARRGTSAARQVGGGYKLTLSLYRGASATDIAAALHKLVPGVRIQSVTADGDPLPRLVVANGSASLDALLQAATGLADVAFVAPWMQPRLSNAGAIGAIQGNDLGSCSGSGAICGPTPMFDHDIIGSGQIVAVADSGVDANEAWFTTLDKGLGPHTEITFAESPAPPAIGSLHPANKVIGYWVQPGATAYDNNNTCPGGSSTSEHGTHTSGTVVGDAAGTFGSNTYFAASPSDPQHELADGMAPNAQLLFQDIGNDASGCLSVTDFDATLAQAYAGGARIHSDSWGGASNGAYTGGDASLDYSARALEDMLIVVAAGNSGPGGGTTGSPGNAKNALTVGALGHAGSTSTAWFSSRGPTADGRIKPDIMAPGTSTRSASGDAVTNATIEQPVVKPLSGTSMATPTVAGNAALMRQFFVDGYYPRGVATAADRYKPSGMVMKAVLINGTNPLQSNWPNNKAGSGRAWLDGNLWFANTLAGGNDSRRLRLFERTNAAGLETGDSHSYSIENVAAGTELRATLTWFDPEAAPAAAAALVNDLDFTVTDPNGTTYLGNHFSNGHSVVGGSADGVDTVEQVRFETPIAGSYTFTVTAASVPGNGRPGSDRQGYALAVSGGFGLPDPTPFPAPTNLAVANNGTAGILVDFNAAGGAQSFQLYRADGTCTAADAGDFRLVATASGASQVTDDRTQGGFGYAYKVRGVRDDVEGRVSACIEVVSNDSCTLVPTFDTQSLIADGANASCAVNLSWAVAQSSCPTAPSVSYTVERDSEPYFGSPQTLVTGLGTTSYSDIAVDDASVYFYRVTSTDGVGNTSSPSLVVNATPSGVDGPNPVNFFDNADASSYLAVQTPWQITHTAASDGSLSYHSTGDSAVTPNLTCAAITTPPLLLEAGAGMAYMARYDMEYQWDGVVQEISTDGGITWSDLPPDGGYPSDFSQTQNPPVNACGYAASHGAFNGVTTASSNADPGNGSGGVFKPFTTDLSAYAGQTVQIRWVMSTDPAAGFGGFYLDELHIASVPYDTLFKDGFDSSSGDYMCQ